MTCEELLGEYEELIRRAAELPEGSSAERDEIRQGLEKVADKATEGSHWLCAFLSNIAGNAAAHL